MGFFAQKKEPVVLDDRTRQKIKKRLSSLDLQARLAVANTRMFICVILMGIVTIFAVYGLHRASIRADNTIRTAWVKMYPNGTWDIDFNDEGRQPDFFQATIDYMLKNWSVRRYSKIPHTINADYGFAHIFMSPALQKEFVSPKGRNAPAAAAEIAACNNCPVTKIEIRNMDHYDADATSFGKFKGTLYRTNVFAARRLSAADGTFISNENIIISLQWRIRSREEIQAEKKQLKANPIGLEIMDYELLTDPNPKGGQK